MEITVVQSTDTLKIRGLVGKIGHETIEVDNFTVAYQWIDEIHYRNELVSLLGYATIAAGVFALVIPPINNAYNKMPLWDRDYLIAGSILVPAGFFATKLAVKKYKKSKGYYWKHYYID
ncbi:hypothetical protein [Schleiferia thermophila]|nr:hypothetical protein [Schleiferia thermophila]GCD80240.1 hypothetical protein JCM30197_14870 [Schleiferia thermophila]